MDVIRFADFRDGGCGINDSKFTAEALGTIPRHGPLRWTDLRSGFLDYRRMRGVPWTAFPVVTSPRLKTVWNYRDNVREIDGPGSFPGRDLGYKAFASDAIATASTLVVSDHGVRKCPSAQRPPVTPRWHLCIAALACRELAPRVSRIVLEGEASGPETLTPGEASEMTRGLSSLHRFRYAYMANATAIFLPALKHAIEPARRDIQAAHAIRMSIPGYFDWRDNPSVEIYSNVVGLSDLNHVSSLDDPMAIQILFRLRRLGKLPHVTDNENPWPSLTFGGLFTGWEDDRYRWEGSGKHTPGWVIGANLNKVAKALIWFALVRSDGSNLMLSDIGERFLDLIHPDAEDPDVLCRWQVPALANEDIDKRVDDWILRVFSKCKTRVNAIR